MADIVLLHGITESTSSWQPLVAPLAARHRVVAVDLLGHGDNVGVGPYNLETLTGAAVTSIAAAGLDPAQVVLVGHSLGGMIATAVATVVTPRGVVNVDQGLQLSGFKDGLMQLEPLLRGDQASFETAIAMVFDSMRGPLGDAEAARIGALRQPRQDVVLGMWDAVLTSSVDELNALVDAVAGDVRCPYLAIHGIDPGDAYGDWLTSNVHGATYELWADHGHYPHLVDPTRFVNRVQAFVDSLD
jgi:pimeloyl-ACP methyl ester carboxylesterase